MAKKISIGLQLITVFIALWTLAKACTIDDHLKNKEFDQSILSDFQKDFSDEGKRRFAVVSLSSLGNLKKEQEYRYHISKTLVQLIVFEKHLAKMSAEEMAADNNCQILVTNFIILCDKSHQYCTEHYNALKNDTEKYTNATIKNRRYKLLNWLPRQHTVISDSIRLTSTLTSTM